MTSLSRLRTSSSTMPHSVGVRRISSPSRVTVLAARSTVKSGVATAGGLVRGGDPAERGAQAGEELVHAERLGDVVVGAGVERGDLVALGAAGGEDDDRHGGPAPQAADDLDAAHSGEAEVEDDGVGMVLGGEPERVLAGGGGVGLVAAGAQVGGEGPEDGRLVVDDEHRGVMVRASSSTTIVVPPPGVSSTVRSPPMARVKPRATASPSPTPAPRRGAVSSSRWNGWKTRSRSLGPDALAPVDDPHEHAAGDDTGLDVDRAGALAVGDGVVDEVGDDALEQRRIGVDGWDVSGDVDDDVARRGPRLASAAGTTSSRVVGRSDGRHGTGVDAGHVEEVVDEVGEPVGLVLDGARGTRRSPPVSR